MLLLVIKGETFRGRSIQENYEKYATSPEP